MTKVFMSFLGANTPRGFVSFFDELYNPYEPCRAYIIKGGPGTGKSTLMNKVANECLRQGYSVEKIYCSSDPRSLDGIIAPELGISIADGTSPHILVAKFPGVCENIINTGEFWDKDMLFQKGDEIRSLTLENSIHHRRSSGYLRAVGSIIEENIRLTSKYINQDKLDGFALRFINRELPKKKASQPGKRKRRFISAITPDGNIFLDEGIAALAGRVIGIDDEYTAVSSLLCERIGESAIKNGYDVIFCQCPMKSGTQCEHIIIPEKRLALVTLRSSHKTQLECDRIIHGGRFLYEDIKEHLPRLRFNRRLIRELTAEAVSALKDAKLTHDALERLYAGAMDFRELDKYCSRLCDEIFDRM